MATRAWMGAIPRARSSAWRSAKAGELIDRPRRCPSGRRGVRLRPCRDIRPRRAGSPTRTAPAPDQLRSRGAQRRETSRWAGCERRTPLPGSRRLRAGWSVSAPRCRPAALDLRSWAAMSPIRVRYRRRSRPSLRRAARRRPSAEAASPAGEPVLGGGSGQLPGGRAISDLDGGARPANATAQAGLTGRGPDRQRLPSAVRPGADSPGHSALSWSCSRCWATFGRPPGHCGDALRPAKHSMVTSSVVHRPAPGRASRSTPRSRGHRS